MELGVMVRDTSGKPEDLEIKLAVQFINKKENRILPLPITTSNYDEAGNYVGYAMFEYELDALFKNGDLNEFIVNIQVYNGNGYKDVVIDQSDFIQLKDENEYVCLVENNRIVVRRKHPVTYHRNWLISLLSRLYRIVECGIGTLLIPLFLLDGVYVVSLGNKRRFLEETYGGSQLKRVLLFAKWRYSAFCRLNINRATFKKIFLNATSCMFSIVSQKDSILFVSSRRTDLTGNIAYVNHELKKTDAKILFWLEPGKTKYMSLRKLLSLAYKIAKSKVIVVDDFTPILNEVRLVKRRKLIQLWHACGAFKTFGFSRVGKIGGPNQTSSNHRDYDYAMVSSSEIRRFYAEGFGIDENKVLALGVPRTDDFFKEECKTSIREKLYEQYPVLKNKKVILFAPTFRGNGAGSAYYPFEKFDVGELLSNLGEDYIVIIKHHPFVTQKHPVDKKFAAQVLDLSKDSEINDLLFVTDILITDYSSVIFEASLLNIPMLFYAYDLEEYIVNRDFYYPFKTFVPGKIVRSLPQMEEAILRSDFEREKVETFKNRFFDDLDGKASERVADFIMELMQNK